MKLWKTALLILLAIVIVSAVYGTTLVRHGFSARETPSSVETFAATTARKLAVPSSYRQLRNPLPGSPENIQAGMEHFADHCATCHANDGSGDTMFGRGLYPKPPDMRMPETQAKTDGELYYVIENGVRLSGMPAFGEQPGTNDEDTWKLLIFIRHVPALTDEEVATMGSLNPKTEEDRQEEQQEEEFLNGGEPPKAPAEAHHHH
jgi:mono/diheme cytochrome c family protein